MHLGSERSSPLLRFWMQRIPCTFHYLFRPSAWLCTFLLNCLVLIYCTNHRSFRTMQIATCSSAETRPGCPIPGLKFLNAGEHLRLCPQACAGVSEPCLQTRIALVTLCLLANLCTCAREACIALLSWLCTCSQSIHVVPV